MPTVIGVFFRSAGKNHYFDPGLICPAIGDAVIVLTARGQEYATVSKGLHELPEEMLAKPLEKVIRLVSQEDQLRHENNLKKEVDAFEIIRKKIADHRLDMKLVSVEYTFDNSKLTAYFTANGRVDFRALVKDLASTFRTRIELKQIGVRDEARMLGGMGACGRELCCTQFLNEFQPVSIRMAKEQSLSLNPTKISGACGRLMCCLKYEQDQYEKARKKMPKLGKEVITPIGRGLVTSINALKETVQVRIQTGDTSDLHEFMAEQVQRVNPPQPAPAPKKEKEARPIRAALPPKEEIIQDEEFLETHVDPIWEPNDSLDDE